TGWARFRSRGAGRRSPTGRARRCIPSTLRIDLAQTLGLSAADLFLDARRLCPRGDPRRLARLSGFVAPPQLLAKALERDLAVSRLAPFLCRRGHDPGRAVRHAHGGLRLVAGLSARARGAVEREVAIPLERFRVGGNVLVPERPLHGRILVRDNAARERPLADARGPGRP